MKNILIGLMIGVLIGFTGSKLFLKSNTINTQKTASHNNQAITLNSMKEAKAERIDVETELESDVEQSKTSIKSRSQPQTIEEYQAAFVNLQQAVLQQNKTVQKLAAENKKLTDDLKNKGGRRNELPDLSAGDIELAKANIQASLAEAPEEYAEVLKTALEAYNSGDALPDADALLRHYADEPDFAWSDVARAYIQNYFAAQADSNIQLVQLNCRKTYCEIYGFYSSGEKLDNPRQAGSQIQSVFNTLEQAPGFSNLFTGLTSASISIDSENSYMTFHNFIRSNQ